MNKKDKNLDKELLFHIAKTSRLNLTDEEINEILPQLSEILNYFSQIQEINTKNTKPSFHPIKLKNSLREDIAKESIDNETALKNTSHKKDGYFKGPKIL